MVQNFADLIDSYGHAPNGTRSYYLTRSQPPFFFAMVGLLSPMDPAAAFARYLPELKTEYAFWMEGEKKLRRGGAHRRVVALDDGSILNRYWDDSDAPRDKSYREDVALAEATPREPGQTYREIRAGAESGWDFSSRWFADSRTLGSIDTTEIIPIDLNALLFGLENAIRAGCERAGDPIAPKITPDAQPPDALRSIAISGINPSASISTIAGRSSSASTASAQRPFIRCLPQSRARRRRLLSRRRSSENC